MQHDTTNHAHLRTDSVAQVAALDVRSRWELVTLLAHMVHGNSDAVAATRELDTALGLVSESDTLPVLLVSWFGAFAAEVVRFPDDKSKKETSGIVVVLVLVEPDVWRIRSAEVLMNKKLRCG